MRALVGAVVVLAGVSLAGCGKKVDAGAQPAPPTGSSSAAPTIWVDPGPPLPSGKPVGQAGDCALPVSFDLPGGWKTTQVRSFAPIPDGEAGLVCEVTEADGKPGYQVLMVVAPPADTETTLRNAIMDLTALSSAEYRPATAGTMPAVESSFSAQLERGRAFAVSTHLKAVIVMVRGPGYEKRLDAYDLAMRTMVATER